MNLKRHIATTSWRRRRYGRLKRWLDLRPEDRILDVGCGSGLSLELFNEENEIVGVDLFPRTRYRAASFRYLAASACELPFPDKSFDVAVSIGLFEHLRPLESLCRAAREIDRVAYRVAVVVPAISTPVEPHFQSLLWQLRSHRWKERRIRRGPISWYPRSTGGEYQFLNSFADESWLNLAGFRGYEARRLWYLPPLISNLVLLGVDPSRSEKTSPWSGSGPQGDRS